MNIAITRETGRSFARTHRSTDPPALSMTVLVSSVSAVSRSSRTTERACVCQRSAQGRVDAIRRTPRTAIRDEYEITDSIQILINDGYITHHHPIVERDLNLTKPADLLPINLIELPRSGMTRLVDESVKLPPGAKVEHSVIGKGVTIASHQHLQQRDHAWRHRPRQHRPGLGGHGRRTHRVLPRCRRAGLAVCRSPHDVVVARPRDWGRGLHRLASDARAARQGRQGHGARQPLGRPPRGRTDGARFVHGDVRDEAAVADALSGVDCVFHLAAQVTIRGSFDRFHEDLDTNVMGTARLLRAVDRAQVKWFTLASSMAVYADADSPAPIDESHPKRPLSPYGVGKLAAEDVSRQILEARGIPFTAVRYFNTYGPGQTYTPYVGVLTIFITRLLRGESITVFGDGEQQRDFIHVSDIVAGTKATPGRAPGRYNLGTGRGTSLNQLAAMVLGKAGPRPAAALCAAPAGELRFSVANIEAARRELGFTPRRALSGDLDEVIAAVTKTLAPGRRRRSAGVIGGAAPSVTARFAPGLI